MAAATDTIRYHVTGMDCASCAAKIEGAARKVEGVDEVKVSIASQIMTLNVDDPQTRLPAIEQAVTSLGYQLDRIGQPKVAGAETDEDDDKIPDLSHVTPAYKRAEGMFVPATDVWEAPGGQGFVDPFRPTIHPGGYGSVEEMRADRDRHLAAVRLMLREMDVFVFTLGLTETWVDRRDGAVFPLCPGVSGGQFDSAIHQFLNLSIDDVRNDLNQSLALLRGIRPKLKVILTVSPVPLKATASIDHVLTATCYSKSVLRVAAHDVADTHDNVGYFPSYEIITGNFNRGAYYADDLREVRPEGVSHVMRTFFEHVAESGARPNLTADRPTPSAPIIPAARSAALLECEEELLEFDRVMAMRRDA